MKFYLITTADQSGSLIPEKQNVKSGTTLCVMRNLVSGNGMT
jgi:hypothetical protein